MRMILASQSRYKKESLQRLGIPFECEDPAIDESPLPGEAPEALVLRLCVGKAATVSARCPGALVIAADQVAELDGEILTKPGTPEGARAQLRRMAGRTHRLLTAVAVTDGVRTGRRLEIHVMTMRPLSDEAIARYVARDNPVDCAGAYKIERAGIALFASVVGADPQAIVGLPLMTLVDLLGHFGVEVP
ncbi:septum formation protein Maf [Myxococcota bacterium]|nr:septum formation protein Maf [Myxococcota bacterium]MBU1511494.1 septum formation protein Maf [Myxococcota bacterium]